MDSERHDSSRAAPLVRIRPADSSDAGFLFRVLAMAMAWRPDSSAIHDDEILARPWAAHYIERWPKFGDYGLVAEGNEPLGATWWRYFTDTDHGFGFVAADVPEITIAVRKSFRGQGIGRQLLEQLAMRARAERVRALSLSVEPDNPAVRLYRSLAFEEVARVGGAVTMVLDLGRPDATNE
jgi:ribosomal protein S18 acetylase RimI-like enzyme